MQYKIIEMNVTDGRNPFIVNYRLQVIRINNSTSISNNDDDDSTTVLNNKRYLIEQQEKTSCYHIPNCLDILFKQNITSKGRDLLLYIERKLGRDNDVIELKLEKTMEDMGISKPTLIKAINELKSASIIAFKGKSVYWINPIYIFNGNRINYFKALGENYIQIVHTINNK